MRFNIYSESLEPAENLSKKIEDETLYHPTAQTELDVVDNVYFFPNWACLYDGDGNRIDSSLLHRDRRNPNDYWPPTAPLHQDIPSDVEVYDQPIIYLSILFPHFGHFVLECIARLWGIDAADDPSAKFLFSESMKGAFWRDGYVAEYLYLLGIPFEKFVSFNKPVKLRRAYIPHPTFYIGGEAYANHRDLPRRASERTLSQIPKLSDQPVYLSRTKFVAEAHTLKNNRTIWNELELESLLREQGFLICYPEMLSLQQKIALYNSHRFIMGTRGTGMLTMLFSLNGKDQETCLLYEAREVYPLFSFCLTDMLAEVKSNYLGLMLLEAGNILKPQPGRSGSNDWRIDIPQTLSWLEQKGVLKSHVPRQEKPDTDQIYGEADSLGGRLTLYFLGWRNITYGGRLSAGRRGNGLRISDVNLEVDGIAHDQIEYQVLNDQGVLSGWTPGGTWCGTHQQEVPLVGFALRLKGQASLKFKVRYVATFIDVKDPIWAEDGRLCSSSPDAPIEAIQIYIQPSITKSDETAEV